MANSCVLWNGYVTPTGYGQMGRNESVHRAAYEEVHGPIPPGYDVHHLCGVRSCFNVDHLEAMPRAEHTRLTASERTPVAQCRHGHDYTPENTYECGGKRFCRRCGRQRTRAWAARRKAAA